MKRKKVFFDGLRKCNLLARQTRQLPLHLTVLRILPPLHKLDGIFRDPQGLIRSKIRLRRLQPRAHPRLPHLLLVRLLNLPGVPKHRVKNLDLLQSFQVSLYFLELGSLILLELREEGLLKLLHLGNVFEQALVKVRRRGTQVERDVISQLGCLHLQLREDMCSLLNDTSFHSSQLVLLEIDLHALVDLLHRHDPPQPCELYLLRINVFAFFGDFCF